MLKGSLVKTILINKTIPNIKANVSCIGYFDGLHKGHKKLLDKTLKLAKDNNLKAALITFDPDPNELINKTKSKHIFSKKHIKQYLNDLGFDYYICIKFDEDLMKSKPLDFINNYLVKLNIQYLICGYDFRFGYKAKGNYETLSKCSKFRTIKIDEYQYKGLKVSSSRIKDSIIRGDFKLTERLLGQEYKITLKVINRLKSGLKYLIIAKSYYSDILLPKDNKYNGFYIENGLFYIESNSKLNKGDIFEFIPR